MEFIYCSNPNADEPIINLHTKIGEDGITGRQFSAELFTLCEMGKKRITVSIISEGGEVFNGYSIHTSMLECEEKYGVEIITLNAGIAASIAGCFSQGGSKRVMYDFARLMLHNPFTSDGSEDKGLNEIRLSLITLISKRCGLSEQKVEELLNDTSWIKASQALELGLVDEVKSSAKMDPNEKAEILNKLEVKSVQYLNTINKKNKLTMNKEFVKILNDAGSKIGENPSDDDVMNAMKVLLKPMDKFKNEDDGDETMDSADCPTMDDKIAPIEDDMSKKYDDLKSAYDKILEDNMRMMKIIKDNEEKVFNDKIEQTIKAGLKSGRIQNSAVEMCKAMAKADFSSFTKFLDALPVNKSGITIETRDFKDELEKQKNEAQIATIVNSAPEFRPSLIQSATADILNKLDNSYNPKNK